jgi:signal transduction histidine kinase
MKETFQAKKTLRVKQSNWIYLLVAFFVFGATLLATFYSWYTISQGVKKDVTLASKREGTDAIDSIQQRLQTYEEIMRGAVGLFNSSDFVSHTEWDTFLKEYDVPNRYPGVQGFGFVKYVTAADLPQHIADMQMSGLANYQVTPAGDRPYYLPIVYATPTSGMVSTAYGMDVSTDPVRSKAQIEAARTGNAVIAGPVTLKQDTSNQIGFLIYMPVYNKGVSVATADERQAALYGYVYAGFRIKTLLNSTVSEYTGNDFALQVYNGTNTKPSNLIYENSTFDYLSKQKNVVYETRTQYYDNRPWTFKIIGSPRLISERERQLPDSALTRGAILSFALGSLVYYLMVRRVHKLTQAKQAEVQSAKDDLLSLASHQLRTPATVVKQYVGMLLHGYVGTLSKQQKTMLQKAYESNERQLNIINQILYVARLDAGQIKLDREQLNLSVLLRQVVNEHTQSIKEHNQTLMTRLPRSKISIEADRQYLHMVFDNLISNASKYTPEGGTIEVSLSENAHSAVISIVDTGVGIDKEDLEAIFEKFTRVDNEMSTQAGGSGIGLYLVQQIVRLHGGTITIESTPGHGSTFIIKLPKSKRKT